MAEPQNPPPRLWPVVKEAMAALWSTTITRPGSHRTELRLTPLGRHEPTIVALWELNDRGRWRLREVRIRDGYGGRWIRANLRDVPVLIREEACNGDRRT